MCQFATFGYIICVTIVNISCAKTHQHYSQGFEEERLNEWRNEWMNECSCQSECNLNDFTSANMARSEYKRFKMCYTKHLCLLNINFAPITPGNSFKIHFDSRFAQKLRGGKLHGNFFSILECFVRFFSLGVSILIWAIRSRHLLLCLRLNKNSISVIICCIEMENVLESSKSVMSQCMWVVRATRAMRNAIVPGRRIFHSNIY